MAITYLGNGQYQGLSSDTKPTTGVTTNSRFLETDTGITSYYDSATWIPAPGGEPGGELGPYLDFDKIAAPADPGAEIGRQYFRTIDANNNGLFIKLKKNGSIVEELLK